MSNTYYSLSQIAKDRQGEFLREAATAQMLKQVRLQDSRRQRLMRIARVSAPALVGILILLLGFLN